MRWAAAVRCHACWPKLTTSHGLPCPAAQTVTALRSSVTAALLIQSRARTLKPKAELRRRQAAATAEHDRVRSELAEKARALFAQQQLQQYQTDWVALRSREDSPPEQATRPRMRPSPPAEDAAVFRRPMKQMPRLAAERAGKRPEQDTGLESGIKYSPRQKELLAGVAAAKQGNSVARRRWRVARYVSGFHQQ